MSELSELLKKANANNWSLREIEAQARRRGHKLSYSAYSKYMNGKHGRPSEEALRAFAEVFSVPLESLREAAHLPTFAEPFILPSEASRLSRGRRDAVLHVVKAMLYETAKESDGNVSTAPITRAGESPVAEDASGDELSARRESNTSSITVDDSRDRLVARRLRGAKKLDEDTTDDPA